MHFEIVPDWIIFHRKKEYFPIFDIETDYFTDIVPLY